MLMFNMLSIGVNKAKRFIIIDRNINHIEKKNENVCHIKEKAKC